MNNEIIVQEFINFIQTRLWMIVVIVALKNVAITFVKSLWLRMSLTLSKDNRYEINGHRGTLIEFGIFGITLKEAEGKTHKIPMSVAVNSIIVNIDKIKK
jgi:small-conductance mechanosensitive channel